MLLWLFFFNAFLMKLCILSKKKMIYVCLEYIKSYISLHSFSILFLSTTDTLPYNIILKNVLDHKIFTLTSQVNL